MRQTALLLPVILLGALPALAVKTHEAKPPITPAAPRTIVLLDNAAPPIIHAALLQSTLIELPPQEKVATVFGGDTVDWVFDAGHVASRYLSIKPKTAGATTDVHIISDHNNEYTLQLQDVSATAPQYDSIVYLEPGDAAAKAKMQQSPTFVPAEQFKEKIAQLTKEAVDAQAVAVAEKKAAATQMEQFRSTYPGTLAFDYSWNHDEGRKLGVQQIWHDARFTYIKGSFNEPPVLYETVDKKGAIVNFDFANGLYTASKIIQKGYLAIGKQRMNFLEVPGEEQ